MRSISSTLLTILLAGCFARVHAQAPDRLQQLFISLQDEGSTDKAANQLREEAKQGSDVHGFLQSKLPSLIARTQSREVWLNAVKLAGDIKVEGAIPVLIKELGNIGTKDSATTFYRQASLEDDPPGKALVAIGEPSVEPVSQALHSTDLSERSRAMYVLINIGSPAAKDELRKHVPEEKDPGIILAIQSALQRTKDQ